jgi:hypothetical protein
MGGIREFNCACLIVSLLLALLLNTSAQFTLLRIICLVFFNLLFCNEHIEFSLFNNKKFIAGTGKGRVTNYNYV